MNSEEVPVTPGSGKLNSITRRNSTGIATNSTSPSVSKSDSIPHYLRASTGSCHDFCKYGRKHDSEAVKRRPNLPFFLANSPTLSDDNQARIPVLGQRRKKLEVKLKQPRNEVSNGSKVIKKKDLSLATVVPSAQVDESSEDMLCTTSVELAPARLVEGSSEEPVNTKLMVSPSCMEYDEYIPVDQASLEEEDTVNLGTPSPTIKSILTAEHLSLDFGSSDYTCASPTEMSIEEPGSIAFITPSAFEENVTSPWDPLPSEAERSYENSTSLKSESYPSVQRSNVSSGHNFPDPTAGSTEGSKSMKPQIPVQKSSVPAEQGASSGAAKSSEKFVSLKLNSPSPFQKTSSIAKHTPGNRAGNSIKKQEVASLGLSDRKKRQPTELKSVPHSQKVVSVRSGVLEQNHIDASGQPNILNRKGSSPVKKTLSMELKQTKLKRPTSFKKTLASSMPKLITKQKSVSPPKGAFVSVKPAVSLKPKSATVKSTSPVVLSGGPADRRNQKNMGIRCLGTAPTTPTGDEKRLRTPKSSLSLKSVSRVSSIKLNKYRNTLPASPVKNRGKVANKEHNVETVKEKTLYMIETKRISINLKHRRQHSREYKPSPSPPPSASSSATFSTSVSPHEKDNHTDCDSVFSEPSRLNATSRQTSKTPAIVSKVDNKDRLRKNAVVRVADIKPLSPHKLKFRRGQIINLQPENNSGPRRLRFRAASPVARENQNEVLRRSFKKRIEPSNVVMDPHASVVPAIVSRNMRTSGENQNEVLRSNFKKRIEPSNDVIDPPASIAPAIVLRNKRESSGVGMDNPAVDAPVVLRHQGVQDRKDTQGLFNNVIEETAKQLVEARKSKVKALVGAFETVISLQESKVGPGV